MSFNICIEYPLYQSQRGNYFIGQTPLLSGETEHALALLKNLNSVYSYHLKDEIHSMAVSASFRQIALQSNSLI